MGHPLTKFKPDTVKAILKEIRRGIPYTIAAEMHEVHESTFRDWRRNGRRDIANQVKSDYSELVRSLREIEGNRIAKNIAMIRKSEKGHRGKEWELERSFWKYFSAKAGEIELNERLELLENKRGTEDESKTTRLEKEETGTEENS